VENEKGRYGSWHRLSLVSSMGGCERSRFQAPVNRQGQPETQTLNNVLNDVIHLSQTDAHLLPRMSFLALDWKWELCIIETRQATHLMFC
jgi:hypothetical protein